MSIAATVAKMRDPVAAHFTLLRYGCREPVWDAAIMARLLSDEPIPTEDEAQFVIDNWTAQTAREGR